jgi:hypothetical protein
VSLILPTRNGIQRPHSHPSYMSARDETSQTPLYRELVLTTACVDFEIQLGGDQATGSNAIDNSTRGLIHVLCAS